MWSLLWMVSPSLWPLIQADRPRIPHGCSYHTPHFSPQQLEVLRYGFRFANLRDDMPVKLLLEGAQPPDVQPLASLSAAMLVHTIKADPHLLREFARKYALCQKKHIKEGSHHRHSASTGDIGTSQRDLPESHEEEAYEGCVKDYDSFVAPITNALSNVILEECEEGGRTAAPCRNGTLPTVPQHEWGARCEYL